MLSIYLGTMSVWCLVLIHLVDVEIFHWISEKFGLMVALDETSGDQVLRIPPLGTMNICSKCHGNPSNSC